MRRDHIPLVPRASRLPFVLLTACFAAWGVAHNMTDPLVNGFKGIWQMTNFQAALVQFSFYGAYFCLALPAALVVKRWSYKAGVLLGLALFIVGSLLFFPASRTMAYGHFLAALFVIAAGLSILETSCNPFVIALGDERTATQRLNLAQAFNPLGSNLGLVLAGLYILPKLGTVSDQQRATLSTDAVRTLQQAELAAVMGPYVGMAAALGALWVLIAFSRMPEASDAGPDLDLGPTFRRLFRRKHYAFGVVAQFFYVGAQICVWTFTLHYVEALVTEGHLAPTDVYAPVRGLHRILQALHLKPSGDALPNGKEIGGLYLQLSLVLFLVSRFVCTALMRVVRPSALLAGLGTCAIACTLLAVVVPGRVGLLALVAVSGCMSVMFPTIYGIALAGLGPDTKVGGAGLVMAILGGALLPLVQGAIVDGAGAAVSYLVPLACFGVVLAYAAFDQRAERRLADLTS